MIVQLIAPAMIKYDITPEMVNDMVISNLKQNGYKLEKNDEYFTVSINAERFVFYVFDNGILVFNYLMELLDNTSYTDILVKKEAKTKEITNQNGAVVNFLKKLEESLAATIINTKLKLSFFFKGQYVSYCQATYRISPNYRNTAYSLALKRKIETEQIPTLDEQSLKVVNVNENTQLLIIWGARVVIGDNEFSLSVYNDYVKNESEAQYLWFIITSLDKKIDEYMLHETGRPADLLLLLDTSYSVLYRKSRFDGVVSSKSHRYEIEIFNSIVSASKIDYLYENLEKKIRFLKEKSSLIEEELNKKNRKFGNILLGIISLLSAISTVYGFISVFQEENKKITYIIVTIVAVVLFIGANLLQHLENKKRNAKNGKLNKK